MPIDLQALAQKYAPNGTPNPNENQDSGYPSPDQGSGYEAPETAPSYAPAPAAESQGYPPPENMNRPKTFLENLAEKYGESTAVPEQSMEPVPVDRNIERVRQLGTFREDMSPEDRVRFDQASKQYANTRDEVSNQGAQDLRGLQEKYQNITYGQDRIFGKTEQVGAVDTLRDTFNQENILHFLPFEQQIENLSNTWKITDAKKYLQEHPENPNVWDQDRIAAQKVLENEASKREYESKDRTIIADAIGTTAQSVPFMMEMAATAGAGRVASAGLNMAARNAAGRLAADGLLGRAMKVISSEAAIGTLSPHNAELALKAASNSAGHVAARALTATTQAAGMLIPQRGINITAETMQALYGLDESQAQTAADMTNSTGDNFVKALYHSAGSDFWEILSEMSGGSLKYIPYAKDITKYVKGSMVGKTIAKYGSEKGTKLLQDLFWHGTLGEMWEERVGEFGKSLTGVEDMPERDFQGWVRQLTVEALAFSVPGLAVHGAGALKRGAASALDKGRELDRVAWGVDNRVTDPTGLPGYEAPEKAHWDDKPLWLLRGERGRALYDKDLKEIAGSSRGLNPPDEQSAPGDTNNLGSINITGWDPETGPIQDGPGGPGGTPGSQDSGASSDSSPRGSATVVLKPNEPTDMLAAANEAQTLANAWTNSSTPQDSDDPQEDRHKLTPEEEAYYGELEQLIDGKSTVGGETTQTDASDTQSSPNAAQGLSDANTNIPLPENGTQNRAPEADHALPPAGAVTSTQSTQAAPAVLQPGQSMDMLHPKDSTPDTARGLVEPTQAESSPSVPSGMDTNMPTIPTQNAEISGLTAPVVSGNGSVETVKPQEAPVMTKEEWKKKTLGKSQGAAVLLTYPDGTTEVTVAHPEIMNRVVDQAYENARDAGRLSETPTEQAQGTPAGLAKPDSQTAVPSPPANNPPIDYTLERARQRLALIEHTDSDTLTPKQREQWEAQRQEAQLAVQAAEATRTYPATAPADITIEHVPEPTDAQKEAGNYQKGHLKWDGLDISVENPAGSTRRGTDRDGNEWENQLQHHYGYIKGTVGKDKDHVDVFINPAEDAQEGGPVFVVNQVRPDNGEFDEHKVMMGFTTQEEAEAAYRDNYAPGWQGLGSIVPMSNAEFKAWVRNSANTKEPAQTQGHSIPESKKEGRTGQSGASKTQEKQESAPNSGSVTHEDSSVPEGSKENQGGLFSERDDLEPTGQTVEGVEEEIAHLRAMWPDHDIVVVQTVDELPEYARQNRGARGLWDEATGTIYLVADNMDKELGAFVALHEYVGHKGLRDLLGKAGGNFFSALFRARWGAITKYALRRGMSLKTEADKQLAAEEWLADRVGANDFAAAKGFWPKLMAIVRRSAQRLTGQHFADDQLAELVRVSHQFAEMGVKWSSSTNGQHGNTSRLSLRDESNWNHKDIPVESVKERADEPVKIVRATPEDSVSLKEAQERSKKFVGNIYTNKDNGIGFSVTGGIVGKLSSDKPFPHVRAAALQHLDELIENSIALKGRPDDKRDPEVEAIHRMFVPFEFQGNVYRIRIFGKTFTDKKVERDKRTAKYKAHSGAVEELIIEEQEQKKSPATREGVVSEEALPHSPRPDTLSVAELFGYVKDSKNTTPLGRLSLRDASQKNKRPEYPDAVDPRTAGERGVAPGADSRVAQQTPDVKRQAMRRMAQRGFQSSATQAVSAVTTGGLVDVAPGGVLPLSRLSIRDFEAQEKRIRRNKKIAETFTPEQIDDIVAGVYMTRAIYGPDYTTIPEEHRGKGISPLRKNSDKLFEKTFDLSTVCPNQDEFNYTVRAIEKNMGRLLTPLERAKVGIHMIHTAGLSRSTCWYCYGSAGRHAFDSFVSRAADMWNTVAPLMNEKNVDEAAVKKLFGTWTFRNKDTGKAGKLYQTMLDHIKQYPTMDGMRIRDILEGTVKPDNKIEAAVAEGIRNFAQAASLRNAPKPFASYLGQVVRMSKKQVEKFNKSAGLRLNSQTDFRMWHAIELAQMMMDLAAKGGMAHVYTRVPNFVKIFGRTGLKFNLSVEVDIKDGVVRWNDMNGFPKEEALRLRKENPNVGTMLVAKNMEELLWGLSSPDIDMIIPFHAGALDKATVDMFRATAFDKQTSVVGEQHEVPIVKGKETWHDPITREQHGDSKEQYLKFVADNGLRPRFEKLIDNPGYMKLVRDVARTERPQTAVDPTLIDWKQAVKLTEEWQAKGGDPMTVPDSAVALITEALNNNTVPESARDLFDMLDKQGDTPAESVPGPKKQPGNTPRFSERAKAKLSIKGSGKQDYDSVKADLDAHPERYREGGKKDGALLAGNGKRSNLNVHQWIQVRTDAFKRWFGDWVHAQKRKMLEEMEPVEIDPEAFGNTSDKTTVRNVATKHYQEHFQKKRKPKNRFDGKVIEFTGRGIREIKNHSADIRVMQIVEKLDELLEAGIPLFSEENHDKSDPSTKAYHYYAASAILGKDHVFVRLVVREDVNGNLFHDNDVTSREVIEKSRLNQAPRIPNAGQGSRGPSAHSLLDWWHSVNPAEVSKVVDENGEPKVMYHATRAHFTKFRTGYRGGIFLSESPETALEGMYASNREAAGENVVDFGGGQNIMPVFVNARRVFGETRPDMPEINAIVDRDFNSDDINTMYHDAWNRMLEKFDDSPAGTFARKELKNEGPRWIKDIQNPDGTWRAVYTDAPGEHRGGKWEPIPTQEIGIGYELFEKGYGYSGETGVGARGFALLGYDAARIHDEGTNTLAVFNGAELKSATANTGAFGPSDDIRFSLKSKGDEAYLSAVERGDMDTAQRMVDARAEEAGYNLRRFHGTRTLWREFSRPNTISLTDDPIKATDYANGDGMFRGNIDILNDPATYIEYGPSAERYRYRDGKLVPEKGGRILDAQETFDDIRRGMSEYVVGTDRARVLDLYVRGNNVLDATTDHGKSEYAKILQFARDNVQRLTQGEHLALVMAQNIGNQWDATKYFPKEYAAVVGPTLKHHGYDGILINDDGGKTLQVFDPSRIKSAAPVTYDENGEVIPLSERFNPDTGDIRYSTREKQKMHPSDDPNDFFREYFDRVNAEHAAQEERWSGKPYEPLTYELPKRTKKGLYSTRVQVNEQMGPHELAAIRDSVGNKMSAVLGSLRSGPFSGERQDLSVANRILSTIAHYAEKVPALLKIYQAGRDLPTFKHYFESAIFNDPITGANQLTDVRLFAESAEKEWKRLQDRMWRDDNNAYGYYAKKEGSDWAVYTPEHKKIASFPDENMAWAHAYQLGRSAIRKSGFSEEAADAWLAIRQIMHRDYAQLLGSAWELKRVYEEAGLEPPPAEYNGEKVSLWEALKLMGDRRGHYLPRMRNPGRYQAFVTGMDGIQHMQAFDTKKGADMWAAKTLGFGRMKFWGRKKDQVSGAVNGKDWRVAFVESDQPSEEAYQDASLAALDEMLKKAIDQLKENTANIKEAEKNLSLTMRRIQYKRKDGKVEEHLVISGPNAKRLSRWFKDFGEKAYPQEEGNVWHIVRPSKHLERTIVQLLTHQDASKASVVAIGQALSKELARLVEQHGSRARKIGRSEAKGDEVIQGYERDVLLAITRSAQSTAGGSAKHIMSKKMTNAFIGVEKTWKEFRDEAREENQNRTMEDIWEEYQAGLKLRRINSSSQPQAYKEAKDFILEMLRNDAQWERIFGKIRGIAAMKYLSSLSSGLVNLTSLSTVVPAVMHAAGIPAAKIPGLIARGIASYASCRRYARTGKAEHKPSDKDWALYQQISAAGLDDALFNEEASKIMLTWGGKAMQSASDKLLLVMMLTERLNRGATLFAAYNGLEGSTEERLQKAQQVMDRAHGVYGKVNLPSWARGSGIGKQMLRSIYMFQNYGHNTLLLMHELGVKGEDRKAAGWMLLAPALIAGPETSLAAWPIEKLAMVTFKIFGIAPPPDIWEAFYDWLGETFGWGAERFGRSGLAGMVGLSLKGSMQTNLPRFIPGIAEASWAKLTGGNYKGLPLTAWDLAGPAGSAMLEEAQALRALFKGHPLAALELAAPRLIASPVKALREYFEGVSTMSGNPVWWGGERLQPTLYDTLLRIGGFNPANVAEKRDEQFTEKQSTQYFSVWKSAIYDTFRDLLSEGDTSPIMEDIEAYNSAIAQWDPEHRISTPITKSSLKGVNTRATKAPRSERLRDVEE